MKFRAVTSCTLIVSAIAAIASCSAPDRPTGAEPLSVKNFLGSDSSADFARAERAIPFQFPRDHGQHPEFRHEWWYITGNLSDSADRRFGFQFTLFRNAVSAGSPDHPSRWATRQTYLAHIAITDIQNQNFYADERFARGALGLAGVEHEPFKAWLEDWHLIQSAPLNCASCFAIGLSASAGEFGMELDLESTRPVVLHGDSGLSQKGEAAGNASYYYSFTRLKTQGKLRLGDEYHQVHGTSWLDHEWSTSSLQEDQVGWDWFSLQLSDNSDLMLFQLRHRDDPAKNYLYGTYVGAQGALKTLAPRDIAITPTETWISPVSGANYPAGWKIEIFVLGISMLLEPVLENQEMNLSFRYWEGAVQASGTRNGRRLSGHGYVELTGY